MIDEDETSILMYLNYLENSIDRTWTIFKFISYVTALL